MKTGNRGLGMRRTAHVLLIVSIAVIALYGVGKPFWLDEAASIYKAKMAFSDLFDLLLTEGLFPPYYLMLKTWITVFGESEAAARMISVSFYLLCFPAAYWAGRQIFEDRQTALLGVFLFALSPVTIMTAQLLKMYTMLGFACLVALGALFGMAGEYRACKFWLYVAANVFGLLLHPLYLPFFITHVFAYAILRRDLSGRRFFAAFGLSLFAFAVVWGPSVIRQSHNAAINWMAPPTFFTPLNALFDVYHLGYAALAGIIVAGYLLYGRSQGTAAFARGLAAKLGNRRVMALLAVGIGTLAVIFLYSHVKPVLSAAMRHRTVMVPPLALALAHVLRHAAPYKFTAVCLAALLALSAGAHIYRIQGYERFTNKDIARLILEKTEGGDYVIFAGRTNIATNYYLDKLSDGRKLNKIAYPFEMEAHPNWCCSAEAMRSETIQREIEVILETIPKGTRVFVSSEQRPRDMRLVEALAQARRLVWEKDLQDLHYRYFTKALFVFEAKAGKQ